MANSRRVLGTLSDAEEAFRRSDRLWEAGAAADPGLLDSSRLLDLKASLRSHQGRFQEALALLDQALEANGSAEARGRILIKKATTFEIAEDYERAIQALREASLALDEGCLPRQLFGVRFNLAVDLLYLERHGEAEALLPEVQELAKGLGNELDLIRVVWLQGRVAAGLGQREEALEALERVRWYFTDERIAYDAALASLEVAVLELEHGRTGRVKTLAEQMLWIFRAQGVHQEALAALRLFCAAAQREDATASLARRIAEYLDRARHNPELRFDHEQEPR